MSTIVALLAAGLLGCGANRFASGVTNAPTTPPEPDALEGFSGELVITRQRDLIDRGLVNVLTRNDSGASMLMSDVAMDADLFDPEASPPRTINVRSGRQVAIQVPYGVAVDCDINRPVAADLIFTYVTDEDATPRTGSLDLAGTDILDALRAEQCATRRFETAVRTRFDNIALAGEALTTDLVIEPTRTDNALEVTGVAGTILIGVSTVDGWPGVALDAQPVTIPLTFVVNRCDPHALAEVTKRYGLDLAVAISGGDPITVGVDIDALVPGFEAIVDQCTLAANLD